MLYTIPIGVVEDAISLAQTNPSVTSRFCRYQSHMGHRLLFIQQQIFFIVLEQCFLLLHSSLYTIDCNSLPNCVPAGQETAAPAAAAGGTVHTTSHQPRTSHRTLHEIIVYLLSRVRKGNAQMREEIRLWRKTQHGYSTTLHGGRLGLRR